MVREGALKLPQEMIANTEKRVRAYESLQAELNSEFQLIEQSINNFKLKIDANVKSEANQDGLLLQEANDYKSCLDFDRGKFDGLMQRDRAQWAQNLDSVRQNADNIKAEFEALLL